MFAQTIKSEENKMANFKKSKKFGQSTNGPYLSTKSQTEKSEGTLVSVTLRVLEYKVASLVFNIFF